MQVIKNKGHFQGISVQPDSRKGPRRIRQSFLRSFPGSNPNPATSVYQVIISANQNVGKFTQVDTYLSSEGNIVLGPKFYPQHIFCN